MTVDELLSTPEGLALANAAWHEGANTMLRSVNDHEKGPWSKPVSPYSAPLLSSRAALTGKATEEVRQIAKENHDA